MKKIIAGLICCWNLAFLQAQNVGIGTNNPVEKLEVSGGVKIGASSNANPGTIRWNAVKNDFEGFNGVAWVSLTGGKGQWGNQASFITENDASQHYLIHSGGNPGDYLGESIAMHNGIAVAGARGDYSSSGNILYSGNAYLYTKAEEGWMLRRTILNPTPAYGENFGAAIGIHNNQIIVGANTAQVSNVRKGEAYVFQYDPVSYNLTLQATLAAIDGEENDYYGSGVDIHGDIAVVGASLKTVSGSVRAGAVYAYKRTGNSWTHIAYLTPADRAPEDRFGAKVSVNGNWLAVSAIHAIVNGKAQAGKVYLYKLNSAGIAYVYHSTITAPDPAAYDRFGTGLHLTGDTLVVGAPRYIGTPSGDGNGKVMLYVRNGDTWQHQHTFTASDGKKGDAFGTSVRIEGQRLIVGAYRAKVGPNLTQGKAYMFYNDGSTWQEEAVFTNSDGSNGSHFGWGVAIEGNDAVISANSHNWLGYTNHGRIYFFGR